MKKKNLKWLISLPIVLTAIPLVAAACNKKTIEKEASYLNLYYSAYTGINGDNYSSYKHTKESREIINDLIKVDPHNKDALENGLELISVLEGDDAEKKFELFQFLANFNKTTNNEFTKYKPFLELLINKNEKFIRNQLDNEQNLFRAFIKYWSFIINSNLKKIDYKYLFFPLGRLNEFGKNAQNSAEIGKAKKIANILSYHINNKLPLKGWKLKEINNTVKEYVKNLK
ncbi:hypothetical protein [Mycoplasma phocoeninasale]|uniref:hypothetical protein n=1 Tax=Mycoplasma phocoeninasale TaxID=2726117 RepID=UPI0019677C73|nr:hypothetical protein [Mycoplasma phocoeninasale]MBN0970491.1 hypothetical protein [Mycoplasma phocoeninasale]